MRGTAVAWGAFAVALLLAAPARAQSGAEPERPVSQPTFYDLDLVGYHGMDFDCSPAGTGVAARASLLAGSARPLWLSLRGTYFVALDDAPQLVQTEILVGRSVWRCDCATLEAGKVVIHTPVHAPGAGGRRVVRRWLPRPPAVATRTVRTSADLVAGAGARMLVFIGDNPDGSHTGVNLVPQAGLWYQQQHLVAGRPGRLRIGLLGAYLSKAQIGSWGLYGHAETSIGHFHLAVDVGGLFGAWAAHELSLGLGYEL